MKKNYATKSTTTKPAVPKPNPPGPSAIQHHANPPRQSAPLAVPATRPAKTLNFQTSRQQTADSSDSDSADDIQHEKRLNATGSPQYVARRPSNITGATPSRGPISSIPVSGQLKPPLVQTRDSQRPIVPGRLPMNSSVVNTAIRTPSTAGPSRRDDPKNVRSSLPPSAVPRSVTKSSQLLPMQQVGRPSLPIMQIKGPRLPVCADGRPPTAKSISTLCSQTARVSVDNSFDSRKRKMSPQRQENVVVQKRINRDSSIDPSLRPGQLQGSDQVLGRLLQPPLQPKTTQIPRRKSPSSSAHRMMVSTQRKSPSSAPIMMILAGPKIPFISPKPSSPRGNTIFMPPLNFRKAAVKPVIRPTVNKTNKPKEKRKKPEASFDSDDDFDQVPSKKTKPKRKNTKVHPANRKIAEDTAEDDVESGTYYVEKVMDKRVNPFSSQTEYRIRWMGYGADEDTWEVEEDCDCPEAIAEFVRLEKQKLEKQKLPVQKSATSKNNNKNNKRKVASRSGTLQSIAKKPVGINGEAVAPVKPVTPWALLTPKLLKTIPQSLRTRIDNKQWPTKITDGKNPPLGSEDDGCQRYLCEWNDGMSCWIPGNICGKFFSHIVCHYGLETLPQQVLNCNL